MAESSASTSKKKAKKGKLQPWQYVAIVAGAGIVYYLYKQHQANAASTAASSTPTSGIDPATGQPYQAGVGSLAPTSASSSSSDPFQQIDPATGVTYAQDIQNLIAQGATTQQAVDQVTASMGGLQSQVGAIGGQLGQLQQEVGALQPPPAPGGTGGGNKALDAWRAAKAQIIAKAEGISVAAAGQAISQYLQGKPITNAAAARGLSNVVKNSGGPPTATGHPLPIRVARQPNKGPARGKVVTTKPAPPRVTHRAPAPAPHVGGRSFGL